MPPALRRWVLSAVVLFPPLDVPTHAARAHDLELVQRDHDDLVAVNNQRRRRRKRLKRRGGPYKVIDVTHAGTIEGVVTFDGAVPTPETIQIVKDHETCDRREKSRPRVRVDAHGRVAEAVVFLGDIKAGKPIPEQTKPTISQHHCTFEPHVQVFVTGQPFDLVNNDPVAHNAQCVQNMITLFNPLQPKQGLRNEFSIRRPGLATVTCAVHNWMKAYVYVLWHPYYAITDEQGRFRIADVPPGQYQLVVWQEHLGERTRAIAVEADKTATLEIELSEK